MNRQRRAARSPPPFGYNEPPAITSRIPPPDHYDHEFYQPLPFEPMAGGGPPHAFMEPPQPYPPAFRDNRPPSSYRAGPMRGGGDPYLSSAPLPPAGQSAGPAAAPYKILCITNLNPKVVDAQLRDALKEDFGQFGEISVTICHDNGERLAYIYFRSYEEAREARHSRSKSILFDKQIEIEPIYEPRSSPIGTPPLPAMFGGSGGQLRRRSVTPPDYYDADDPSVMEFARARQAPPHMHPHHLMPYHRGGGLSPPPPLGYPPMVTHQYGHPNQRQSSPGPAPYGRGGFYMGPGTPPVGPQSPYSSPPHDPYARAYHPGMPFPASQQPYPHHGLSYGPSTHGGREPRERPQPLHDGHLARSPRYDSAAYYTMDGRGDYPPPPANYPQIRSPHMQPGPSHHYQSGPPPPDSHHGPSGYSMRQASPPSRYADQPRYTSREFRREKFGGDHGDAGDGKPSRVLFITNIDPSKTESELRNIFDPYGTIEEVEVRKISSEIASAIIKFSSMDCAYKAKTALHGKYLGKVKCRILYGKVSASKRLWIGGFGPNTTMVRLEDEFGRYGEIVNLDYISGRPYAYIEYESANQAQFATQHLRGTFVAEAERRIRIEYVDPIKNDKTGGAKQQATTTPSTTLQSPKDDKLANAHDSHISPQSRSIKRRSITPTDAVGAIKKPAHIFEGSPKSSSNLICDERKYKSTNEDESIIPRNDPTSLTNANDNHSNSRHDENESVESRLARSRCIREIVDCCSISWSGQLVLRNFLFNSKMFLFRGHKGVIEKYITKLNGEDGDQCPVLPITQRWRLHSQPKLEEVKRRMQSANLGMIIILPKADQQSPATSISSPASKTPMSSSSNQGTGATTAASNSTPSSGQNGDRDKESSAADVSANSSAGDDCSTSAQARPLKNLISYLEQKDAAGVISLKAIDRNQDQAGQAVGLDGHGRDSKTLYAFPPGDFASNLLKERAPNLRLEGKEEFLLGVIVSGASEAKQI